MGSEGRKHSRIRINRKVVIMLSNGDYVTVRACDISEGGIGVVCPYNVDVGKVFEIYFDLTGNAKTGLIKAKAVVRFVNLIGSVDEFRIGFEFKQIYGKGQELLESYLQKRGSQPNWV